MIWAFWLAAAVIAYAYVGYTSWLRLRGQAPSSKQGKSKRDTNFLCLFFNN